MKKIMLILLGSAILSSNVFAWRVIDKKNDSDGSFTTYHVRCNNDSIKTVLRRNGSYVVYRAQEHDGSFSNFEQAASVACGK